MSKEQENGPLQNAFRRFDIVEHILESAHTNPTLKGLVQYLSENIEDVQRLLEYGIQHLPNEEGRPDKEIASFFFLITELSNATSEQRDVAMEGMIYCENDSSFPTCSRDELIHMFKK